MGLLVGFPWVLTIYGHGYGKADSVVPDSMGSRLMHDSGYVLSFLLRNLGL